MHDGNAASRDIGKRRRKKKRHLLSLERHLLAYGTASDDLWNKEMDYPFDCISTMRLRLSFLTTRGKAGLQLQYYSLAILLAYAGKSNGHGLSNDGRIQWYPIMTLTARVKVSDRHSAYVIRWIN